MEVHHHPEVEKKGLKEYVLEGLMIFLAVMMGFFAEGLREHIADRHRETAYMVSMTEDLKSDTASLSATIRYGQRQINMVDSIIFLLRLTRFKENGNSIYFFARSIGIPENIFSNDRTIQQLKSSGSLRLINNWKVSNSIMAYDQKMRAQVFGMNEDATLRAEYRKSGRKIFDSEVFNDMLRGLKIIKPVNNPQLLTTDATSLNNYISSAQYLKRANQINARRAAELLAQAKQLMELIKKEYRLEDE